MLTRFSLHSGRLVWSVVAVALLGLALLAFSCAAPAAEKPAVTPTAPAAPAVVEPVKPPVVEPPAEPAAKPAVISVPPAIPHTLEGRDNCLMCHQIGAAGVGVPGGTGLTDNHQGRTIETCRGCHQTAG